MITKQIFERETEKTEKTMKENLTRPVTMTVALALYIFATLPAHAGYAVDGTKKGVKEGVGGTKKGYGYAEGGTKKGVKEGVGGTKKGIKETKKFFKKVF
jgi:hypothetical protein